MPSLQQLYEKRVKESAINRNETPRQFAQSFRTPEERGIVPPINYGGLYRTGSCDLSGGSPQSNPSCPYR